MAKCTVQPRNDCGCLIDMEDVHNPQIIFCTLHDSAEELFGAAQQAYFAHVGSGLVWTALKNVLDKATYTRKPLYDKTETPQGNG